MKTLIFLGLALAFIIFQAIVKLRLKTKLFSWKKKQWLIGFLNSD